MLLKTGSFLGKLYRDTMFRGQWPTYDITSYVTGTNFTCTKAFATPKKDVNGKWTLENVNIVGIYSMATVDHQVAVNGKETKIRQWR